MFPVKRKYKLGYKFGVPTYYNNFHLGVDLIIPTNTPIYAPEDGVLKNTTGRQGGITATLKSKKYTHRFLHLSKHVPLVNVKEGDIIAYSGNSGLSTAPHVHIDVSNGALKLNDKNNFVDPLQIYKKIGNNNDMTVELKKQVRRLQAEVRKLTKEVNIFSERLEAEKQSNFDTLEKYTSCNFERDQLRQTNKNLKNGLAQKLSLLDKIKLILKS